MSSKKTSICVASERKTGAELVAQQLELRYPPTPRYIVCGYSLGGGVLRVVTSKHLTESRARHVTFPRVFPIGLWGVRYSLFIIIFLILDIDIDIEPTTSIASPWGSVGVDFWGCGL